MSNTSTLQMQSGSSAVKDVSSSWMYNMMDKQGSLTPRQDPADEPIHIKLNDFTSTIICPIMYKLKQKPKTYAQAQRGKEGREGEADGDQGRETRG